MLHFPLEEKVNTSSKTALPWVDSFFVVAGLGVKGRLINFPLSAPAL